MRHRWMAVLLLLAYVGMALPASSEEPRRLVRLEGWIVDSFCRAKNANPAGAVDTVECLKKGAKLILITPDGTTYDLEDQEKARLHLSKPVHVFGLVDKDRNLRIGNYIGTEPGPDDNRSERAVAGPGKKAPPKPEPEQPQR